MAQSFYLIEPGTQVCIRGTVRSVVVEGKNDVTYRIEVENTVGYEEVVDVAYSQIIERSTFSDEELIEECKKRGLIITPYSLPVTF